MKKLFAASIIAAAGIFAVTTTADAAQGCGYGRHRNYHGYCVRNHRVVYMPPPPMPVYRQTILAPARTGLIPGSAKTAHSVCSYNYHPNPNGDCVAN